MNSQNNTTDTAAGTIGTPRKSFTPGPWFIRKSDSVNNPPIIAGPIALEGNGDFNIATVHFGGYWHGRVIHANARLMAAAPDMYAALKRIRDARDTHADTGAYPADIKCDQQFDDWAADVAAAALAKAGAA